MLTTPPRIDIEGFFRFERDEVDWIAGETRGRTQNGFRDEGTLLQVKPLPSDLEPGKPFLPGVAQGLGGLGEGSFLFPWPILPGAANTQ